MTSQAEPVTVEATEYEAVKLWMVCDNVWGALAGNVHAAAAVYARTHPNRPESIRYTVDDNTYTARWEKDRLVWDAEAT